MKIEREVPGRIRNILEEMGISSHNENAPNVLANAAANHSQDIDGAGNPALRSLKIAIDVNAHKTREYSFDPENHTLTIFLDPYSQIHDLTEVHDVVAASRNFDKILKTVTATADMAAIGKENLGVKTFSYFAKYLNNEVFTAPLQKYELFRALRAEIFTRFAVEPYWTISYVVWRASTLGQKTNINQLRANLQLPQSTISRKVDDLVESKRLVRQRDKYDRRIVWLCPAPLEALRFFLLMSAIEDNA